TGPRAMIDTTGRKLLVVAPTPSKLCWRPKLALFRCSLDGSGCIYADISAGQPPGSGWNPSAVIDDTNRKLLVGTRNEANGNRPALFQCNVDGTGCTYTDISAGRAYSPLPYVCQGFCSFVPWFPAAVIDATKGKLFVVTQTSGPLFRCAVDGTGCVLF